MSQQPQQPDLQQVLIELQQANINQSTIDFISQLGTTQQQTQDQINILQNGLASVQHVLTAQQQTISAYQHQQQQSQHTLTKHVKIEKPAKFNGNQQDFAQWLFQFEQYCEIIGLKTKPVEMAQYAVTLLEKAALTWWQVALKSSPQTLRLSNLDWSTLKSEMESQFKDSDRERKLLSTFSSFQQINELDTYVTNFRKLVLELGKLVTDESVLWQFVKGLKPHLRKEVLKDPNLKTVSDAILIAERLNAAEKFADNFSGYKHKNKQYKQQVLGDYSDPMDIDTIRENNYKHRAIGNSTRGNGRQTRGSYPTRGTLHQARGSGRNTATRDTQCYYCGNQGHFARNCFAKQRDQQQQGFNNMATHACNNCTPPTHVLPAYPPAPDPKN